MHIPLLKGQSNIVTILRVFSSKSSKFPTNFNEQKRTKIPDPLKIPPNLLVNIDKIKANSFNIQQVRQLVSQ